jgi:hypothetical protein
LPECKKDLPECTSEADARVAVQVYWEVMENFLTRSRIYESHFWPEEF